MKRRLDLTPGFPAFLAAVWYFDSCGIFWPFLAAMTVHELAHAAVLLLLGGRIESVRLSFAQVELRTGLLSDRSELWSTAAGPGINLLCGWLFRRWMPAFAAVSSRTRAWDNIRCRVLHAPCAPRRIFPPQHGY